MVKIGKNILITVLTVAVILGGYLGYARYLAELQDRNVEVCVDLNDIKKIAAFENKPLSALLKEIRELGVSSIGIFEETLPDANALGELYYAKGSGILRLGKFNPRFDKLSDQGIIKDDKTYIYLPSDIVRKRIYYHFKWALGEQNINFIGNDILEIDKAEEELREIGLGISEAQATFISGLGFNIIPRVWNDTHYHELNIGPKIAALQDFDKIIFEGEEILGYPNNLRALGAALKQYRVNFGNIEIISQYGKSTLGGLVGNDSIRVHSIAQDELRKISKATAVSRLVRAARERKVKLLYIRPFLPPYTEGSPVAYNLDYLKQVIGGLQQSGLTLGATVPVPGLDVSGRQILILGSGVVVGALLLLNSFINVPIIFMILLFLSAVSGIAFIGLAGYGLLLQKGLALLAGITFPSLAVISTLSKKGKIIFSPWDCVLIVLNIIAETMIGVFLMFGLLADYRFMLSLETFAGVKIALLAPIGIVALYFILEQEKGSLVGRLRSFLSTKVSVIILVIGFAALGALAILIARSANFVLPVPELEKSFRGFLETAFVARPRTKEFLIGYPLLFLAATLLLRNKKKWLWVTAALGTIAPISVFNSFSHIHTPIVISMTRTINGLGLGVIIGTIVASLANRFIKT
ncbi:hypothetical protein A3H38_01355 [candidate division WOR-1 bacterium RIFCSPLOWO2_02_FULL_46_20]|uniref:Uncharacterized protein n=2 Tax=Saganbacteria TaxID=1703751 RepID=A0A1F4RD33_UNCSA|nr:MAG: hypothetical protein A3H38_01355 [candidate division WOR-1 bacterium RIFCSPLOWO2_02_FULL_46_20]